MILCNQLITGLEQSKFISEQDIMSVYSIKHRLLTDKPNLMKQTTFRKMFTKLRHSNTTSSDTQVVRGNGDTNNNVYPSATFSRQKQCNKILKLLRSVADQE